MLNNIARILIGFLITLPATASASTDMAIAPGMQLLMVVLAIVAILLSGYALHVGGQLRHRTSRDTFIAIVLSLNIVFAIAIIWWVV